MAKLGKGSAQVNLILNKQEYKPGEQINGELIIQGGTVEQAINNIDIDFLMSVHVGEHEQTVLINRFPFHESFQIQPAERKYYSFSYELPKNLLVSGYSVGYYFITHLDIAAGMDSTDHDPVYILPPERFHKILKSLDKLGFREKYGSRSFNGQMQEFAWEPTTLFKNEISEIELVAAEEETGIHLLLEVDLRTSGGEKEVKRELWFDNELLNNETALREHLQHTLTEIIDEPSAYHADKAQFQQKLSGLPGVIGSFAVGLIAMDLLEEAVEETVEAMAGEEEPDEEGGSRFFDFFEGEDAED